MGAAPNFYHTNNSYLRVFDLSAFGITSSFGVTQVQFGIEQGPVGRRGRATAHGQPVLQDRSGNPLTFANLTPIGTASVTVPDQA